VALLPDFACEHERAFVRYLRSDCPPMEIYAVWLRSERSRLLHDYLEILRSQAQTSIKH
jgi:hypothetical protein